MALKSSGCTLKFSAMAAKMSPIRSFCKMQKKARSALSGLLRLAVEQENKKNRNLSPIRSFAGSCKIMLHSESSDLDLLCAKSYE